MNTEQNHESCNLCSRGLGVRTGIQRLARALACTPVLTAALALASTAGASTYDPNASYPLLPDLPGADIEGEASIIIHLNQGRAVIELDGQFYDVGDRPLEVDFAGLARLTVFFMLTDAGDGLFVTEDQLWTDTLDTSPRSHAIAFDIDIENDARFPVYEFEVTTPGQDAPTFPDIVVKPTQDDPDPT